MKTPPPFDPRSLRDITRWCAEQAALDRDHDRAQRRPVPEFISEDLKRRIRAKIAAAGDRAVTIAGGRLS
jgi:hypothetical protein